jgi:hypothetical protein
MRIVFAAVAVFLIAGGLDQGFAQTDNPPPANSPPPTDNPPPAIAPPASDNAGSLEIAWEVTSRFRLFRYEKDFLRHVAADRGDGILAAERRLAGDTEGRGWARTMINSLCVDPVGRLMDTCERDGEQESYLSPTDHRVAATVAKAPAEATCTWTFDDGEGPARQASAPCGEEMRARVRYGKPTVVTVDAALQDGTSLHGRAEILVRDRLIAGLGDSIASGEGNPDRPVALADDGFCFRRFLGNARSEYFRPGRAGYRGSRSCEAPVAGAGGDRDWNARAARWMSAACHASLYSYQLRTALAIAIADKHAAVTFLPLACTGARIEDGLFKARGAREIACEGRGRGCAETVPAQLETLRNALTRARRNTPDRKLDLILLTIGANDIQFAGLVADTILDETSTERGLFKRGGLIASVADADAALQRQVPADFAQAAGRRRPVARRLRVLRRAGLEGGRDALPRRTRRLRHPSGVRGRRRARARGKRFRRNPVPAAAQGPRAVRRRRAVQRRARPHDLRRRASRRLCRARLLRPRRQRPGVRQGLLLADRRQLPQEPGRCRGASAQVRAQRSRVPPLCIAGALDPHRQRQLLHRHDLSRKRIGDAAAERYPRCHLGRHERGLWRRAAPDRGRPRGDGRRGISGGTSGAGDGARQGAVSARIGDGG